ncbi:MAG: hypothetical protein IJY62_00055 [Clostridia bacterium]|nr:hypothetical protein [Clostridia bacterium]
MKKFIASACIGLAATIVAGTSLAVTLGAKNGDVAGSRYFTEALLNDPTANPDYDVDELVATPNELGWTTLDIWEDKLSAFRTCRKNEEAGDHWRVAFVEDNTMMLWAMSKGTYKWSHHQGYPAAIRDFILECIKSELDGTFFMGKYSGQNDDDFVYTSDLPDGLPFVYEDPYVPFMPLWGVVSYTAAYPEQGGNQIASYYRNYTGLLLKKQQKIIDAGKLTYCLTSSSLAFHMASNAVWYKFTREAEYLKNVEKTWAILKKRINRDNSIKEELTGGFNPLRHIQCVWGMFETLRMIGDIGGMGAAMERCRAFMKPSEKYGAGIWMYSDSRASEMDDSNCTALQIAYGYYYLSSDKIGSAQEKHGYEVTVNARENIGTEEEPAYVYDTWVTSEEEGLAHSGTCEGNSMAWLVEWWREVLSQA